ncbi:MAG: MBL fold metallo-hydrolase [Calditrichaceae bacterium]|nr:MBL fold metallo-hydrolase [Calditrichaceae bacterium]MBN2707566.1 MBL fold metallo-hydrolase [Calditrichaceae bacterium]RQV95651.1 MAG: MBL fold metallo-hydrolase [Calditrichota bacterium]
MTKIRFWGVRGSIPTPGPSTVRYGGNTSCVEVSYNDSLIILDAGSGLRELGQDLLKRTPPIKANIFISHMHWDHIQGIPFFTPAFVPGNQFNFYGGEEPDKDLATIIADQMDPTYFPVELKDMGAELTFNGLYEGQYKINGYRVDTIYLNHPGNALGYKFYFDDKTLIYISDNEPYKSYLLSQKEPEEILIGEDATQKLINFLQGTDLLIHDAQYTKDEYLKKVTWGHSPVDYTVYLALQAKVKHLVLFHHDPMHDDITIDRLLEQAQKSVKDTLIKISAAYENMIIEL